MIIAYRGLGRPKSWNLIAPSALRNPFWKQLTASVFICKWRFWRWSDKNFDFHIKERVELLPGAKVLAWGPVKETSLFIPLKAENSGNTDSSILWNLKPSLWLGIMGIFLACAVKVAWSSLWRMWVNSLFPMVQLLHYAHIHIFLFIAKERPIVDAKSAPENKCIIILLKAVLDSSEE